MIDKIQYISQGSSFKEQYAAIEEALDAGCTWLQLRCKNASAREALWLAAAVKKITESYNCKLIINDYPVIAKEVDANGIHLGLEDMPVAQAREIIGPNKLIGGTANTLADVLQRHNEGCNYIGLGPFRFTATKEKLSPVLGLQGYVDIMYQLKQQQITTPIIAIGGIEQEDMEAILETGIYGVALSGLVTRHPQKKELFNQLYTLWSH